VTAKQVAVLFFVGVFLGVVYDYMMWQGWL
jgi:hypothetical protein